MCGSVFTNVTHKDLMDALDIDHKTASNIILGKKHKY